MTEYKEEDDEDLEYFAESISYYPNWLISANQLYSAAKFLEKPLIQYWETYTSTKIFNADSPNFHIDLQPQYLMLMGFAMENYLKAVIVKKMDHIALYKLLLKSKKIPGFLKDHSLINLVSKAGLKINPEDEFFLKRLSSYLIWIGRYPASTNYSKFDWQLNLYSSSDLKKIDQLFALFSKQSDVEIHLIY